MVENDLTPDEKAFFESFFYCCIRCFANDVVTRYGIYESFEECSTFQHIIDKASLAQKDTAYKDYTSLVRNEYSIFMSLPELEELFPLSGFFAVMDACYLFLTEGKITDLDEEGFSGFSDTEFEYHVPEISDEDMLAEAKRRGFSSVEEWNEYEINEFESDEEARRVSEEAAIEEYEERERRVKLINEERLPAWEKYRKDFGSIDKFIKQYKRYRELYFRVDAQDISSRVESMCTDFLCRKGLLPYADDDALADEVIDIERCVSRLKNGIRRRRAND